MIAVASVMTSLSFGDIYTDPAGDIATGNANLDITQVEITDNGLELFVSMTVADLDGDWGKYLFFSNYTAGGSADTCAPPRAQGCSRPPRRAHRRRHRQAMPWATRWKWLDLPGEPRPSRCRGQDFASAP